MSTASQFASLSFEDTLMNLHGRYKEKAFPHPRFRHRDLVPLLMDLRQMPGFEVELAGKSVEEREIYLVKIGTGPRQVLLWSQMHGNEPTATMALLDFFNFLADTSGELVAEREQILAELTVYVLPMLNPDGAERFQRNNALDVDLNRDARRLVSPEAQLLHHTCMVVQPEFGFNLHDMDYRHSVGDTGLPATISFLAPPADAAKSHPPARIKAIQLISHFYQSLQPYLSGRMGRWPDNYEPRAFGDTIQAMGTSVVLLEAGGYPDDPDKVLARQLTFLLLVSGLQAIANEDFRKQDGNLYHQIPENGPLIFDLVVRKVRVKKGGQTYTVDLGIMREDLSPAGSPLRAARGEIVERGDLSVPHAYEYLEAAGLQLQPGKIYPKIFPNPASLTGMDLMSLLRQGYLYVRVETCERDVTTTPLPVNLIVGKPTNLVPYENKNAATFVLEKEGKPVLAVVNGFAHDLSLEQISRRYNGLIYR